MNVILLIFIPLLSCNFLLAQDSTYTACNDFVDYVCKDKPYKANGKLKRKFSLSKEVQQFQEYVYPNEKADKDIWEEISSERISYWLLEYSTLFEGISWNKFRNRHERMMNISHESRVDEIETIIKNFDVQSFYYFYYGLQKNIKNLEILHIPVCKKNPFYHSLYTSAKNTIISLVEKYSSFSQVVKEKITQRFNKTKILFPYADYNDVEILRAAKREYEKEYYRLKAAIKPEYLENEMTSALILLASIDKSMHVLKEYMNEFSEGFIFQYTIAASTPDAFNYEYEILVSIFTRINPEDTEEIYSNVLFTIGHELLHSIYNLDDKDETWNLTVWEKEKTCANDRLKYLSKTDRKPLPESWSPIQYIYEDLASADATRIIMLHSAEVVHDMDQMRKRLEKLTSVYCENVKNTIIQFHNPNGISINYAVSQLPIFKILYNCTEGDRMFVRNEDICSSMAIEPAKIDYSIQTVDRKEYPFINTAINFLEESANEVHDTVFIIFNRNESDSSESSESSESNSDENRSELFYIDDYVDGLPNDNLDSLVNVNETDLNSDEMRSVSSQYSLISFVFSIMIVIIL